MLTLATIQLLAPDGSVIKGTFRDPKALLEDEGVVTFEGVPIGSVVAAVALVLPKGTRVYNDPKAFPWTTKSERVTIRLPL